MLYKMVKDKKMRVIGLIPARYGSTRFPGKLLADLNGKPVIQHVYEQAKKATMLDYVVVATDSDRIYRTVREFGGNVCVTDRHETGTERVAEAMDVDMDADIIINIQGDEPFICPLVLNELVNTLLLHADEQVASIGCSVMSIQDIHDKNVVKVEIDSNGYAVGFSRMGKLLNSNHAYKHIGIYAYRREFLQKFVNMCKSKNEIKESLEQLRILDNGYKIKMVITDHDTISIDTPEDLEKARRHLNESHNSRK